jgi:hypothetical protein
MWETWFTRQFSPWEHFVPLANDLSDLGEKIEWCRAHDAECRDIASRATARAEVVYGGFAVATAAAAVLRERLLAT